MKQIESFRTASLRNNEDYGFHTLVSKPFLICLLFPKEQQTR